MAKYSKHPCVFRGSFIRNEVDPRVQRVWDERFGGKVPFGSLRLLFRQVHCSELNPYGSDSCAYAERDCAVAFYQCVVVTCGGATDRKRATGYFRSVARRSAIHRADTKPLARDRDAKATTAKGPGNTGASSDGSDEGRGLHGSRSRPVSIADVLRSLDLGPREGRAPDGREGTE